MYRRPKFLEMLLEIRREMALEADYDVDLFVGRVRNGGEPPVSKAVTEPQSTVERINISTKLKLSRRATKG